MTAPRTPLRNSSREISNDQRHRVAGGKTDGSYAGEHDD